MKSSKSGFTLIEILVAMTIVAVLMGLALVSYQGARKSARDGKRKVDLEQVRSALEMRRADCGSYSAGSLSSGGNITGDGSSSSCIATTIYITIPNDPLAGRNYVYTRGLTANLYTLCAALEVGGTPGSCGAVDCGVVGAVKICDYKTTNP